jgi:hypothetical protein
MFVRYTEWNSNVVDVLSKGFFICVPRLQHIPWYDDVQHYSLSWQRSRNWTDIDSCHSPCTEVK